MAFAAADEDFLGVGAGAALVVLAGADFLDLALLAAVAFFVVGAGAFAAFFLASGFLAVMDVEVEAAVDSFLGLFFSRSSFFLFRSNSLSWSSSL